MTHRERFFMSSVRQTGFTLIELIVFIVVVSAGMAGILSVMDNVVKSSADPMVRKQAMALAESLLEEVVIKAYCDPDTVDTSTSPPTCGVNTVESGRDTYDAVDDYDGLSETLSGSGPLFLNMAPEVMGYTLSVNVASATLGALPVKRITVQASRDNTSVALIGYRANY